MGTKEGWYYEWIELYNNSEESMDISGWKIENAGTKNNALEISTGKILPKSFFLICKKERKDCDLITWTLSLSNDYKENGRLILKDNVNNIIDQTPEPESKEWPAGLNQTPKQTMERKDGVRLGSDPENWQTSQNPGGTAKAENSSSAKAFPSPQPQTSPTPTLTPPAATTPTSLPPLLSSPSPKLKIEELKTIYPTGIIINELLPSPLGADETDEWIEIFNENNFEVALSGWQMADTVGKTTTYTFPKETKIPPKGFLLLSRPETKITLNNDEDGLSLSQPNGNILDNVNYQKAPRGQSYNRTEGGWVWSSTLTPGSANIIPAPSAKIKDEKKNKEKPQKELAAVSESFRQIQEKQIPKPLFTFLVVLGLAIFSGVIILILKRKIKGVDLGEKL